MGTKSQRGSGRLLEVIHMGENDWGRGCAGGEGGRLGKQLAGGPKTLLSNMGTEMGEWGGFPWEKEFLRMSGQAEEL